MFIFLFYTCIKNDALISKRLRWLLIWFLKRLGLSVFKTFTTRVEPQSLSVTSKKMPDALGRLMMWILVSKFDEHLMKRRKIALKNYFQTFRKAYTFNSGPVQWVSAIRLNSNMYWAEKSWSIHLLRTKLIRTRSLISIIF